MDIRQITRCEKCEGSGVAAKLDDNTYRLIICRACSGHGRAATA